MSLVLTKVPLSLKRLAILLMLQHSKVATETKYPLRELKSYLSSIMFLQGILMTKVDLLSQFLESLNQLNGRSFLSLSYLWFHMTVKVQILLEDLIRDILRFYFVNSLVDNFSSTIKIHLKVLTGNLDIS